MSLLRTWFEPCAECEDAEACKDGRECAQGYDCEHAAGFDLSREQEEQANDPRRQ